MSDPSSVGGGETKPSTLSEWLEWKQRHPSDYKTFDLIEITEQRKISKPEINALASKISSARVDPELVRRAAEKVGWKNAATTLVVPMLPTLPNVRKGLFGETLAGMTLVDFFGYQIPVQKLRYSITKNQTLPGTDIIAVKYKDGGLTELCFVEVKLRTGEDTAAAKEAYGEIQRQRVQKIPALLSFITARLQAEQNPLFDLFLRYLLDRHDTTKIESTHICLVWEKMNWSEKTLVNLEDSITTPSASVLTVDLVIIENLVPLVGSVFEELVLGG